LALAYLAYLAYHHFQPQRIAILVVMVSQFGDVPDTPRFIARTGVLGASAVATTI
jgi:hypothetical protein